jgi:hypothetical protein
MGRLASPHRGVVVCWERQTAALPQPSYRTLPAKGLGVGGWGVPSQTPQRAPRRPGAPYFVRCPAPLPDGRGPGCGAASSRECRESGRRPPKTPAFQTATHRPQGVAPSTGRQEASPTHVATGTLRGRWAARGRATPGGFRSGMCCPDEAVSAAAPQSTVPHRGALPPAVCPQRATASGPARNGVPRVRRVRLWIGCARIATPEPARRGYRTPRRGRWLP